MELWDLYDMHRNKMNQSHVRGEKIPEGGYHMVVNVCLFNSKGEMLIQQRAKDKEGWPNLWDITCGGSALQGETSQQAMQRELFEELGIQYDFSKIRPYFTINFNVGFHDIYLIDLDIDLKDVILQEEEVQNVKWATRDEILLMIENKEFINYYPSLIQMIFEMHQNHMSCLHSRSSYDLERK